MLCYNITLIELVFSVDESKQLICNRHAVVEMSEGTQLEFFAIPSPCIGVCQTGDNGFCIGCFRSRDERLYWLKVDDATRRKIVAACHRRKKRALLKAREAENGAQDTSPPTQNDLFDTPE